MGKCCGCGCAKKEYNATSAIAEGKILGSEGTFKEHHFLIEMQASKNPPYPSVNINCELKNVTKNVVIFSETRTHVNTEKPYFEVNNLTITQNYVGDTIRLTVTSQYVMDWILAKWLLNTEYE
ncbi:MAG: hypothetical protein NWE95_06995 [Candidatus Bathyarchaeota archaeon]|nr:hypothetical protein [Candidatus Bathyarchaeota archaeon]